MNITPARLAALPVPDSKAALLERIPLARAALEATLAPLSEAQLARPGPEGWAVVDHLLHLAVWQEMIVAHLRDGSDHAVAGLDPDAYAAIDLESLNAHLHRRARGTPPVEAFARFRSAYGDALAFLQSIPEDAFTAPYWPDEPRTVIEKVTGDTYRHDLEHRVWIENLLAAGRPSS